MIKNPTLVRSTLAALMAVVLGLGAFAALQGTASAAKGGKNATTTRTATLSIQQPVAKVNEYVTFTGTYPSSTRNPYVVLTCWQGGKQIYQTGGPISNTFWLTTDAVMWVADGTGGYCQANLVDLQFNGTEPPVMATTLFDLVG